MIHRTQEYDFEVPDFKCLDCGEKCEIIEESFDYPGTHCNYGNSGTHYTGHYYSGCCGSEYEELE